MKSIGAMRSWLESVPIERDGVSWAVSLSVHLSLLVLLAVIWQHLPDRPKVAMLSSADAMHEPPALHEVDYSAADTDSEEVGGNSLGGTGVALAQAPTLADVSRVDARNMAATEVSAADLPVMVELSTAPNLNDKLIVKGDAGVGTTGAEGAVDRITQEILLSLDQRPTLVVWLMDQSESLRPQRAAIEKRFDRIYEELGVIESRTVLIQEAWESSASDFRRGLWPAGRLPDEGADRRPGDDQKDDSRHSDRRKRPGIDFHGGRGSSPQVSKIPQREPAPQCDADRSNR